MIKPLAAMTAIGLALAACASPSRYPSLAIRDAERASGTLQPAEAAPYVPPAPPPETLDRIDRLTAEAQAAHRAFLAEAESSRAVIAAGRGAAEGNEAWSKAQIALADLEASRSQATIALAELDRLYVDNELEGADLTRLAAARDQVAALIETEDETLDGLR